jgi:hypothetical protein
VLASHSISNRTPNRLKDFLIEDYPATLKLNSQGQTVLAHDSILEIFQSINIWRLRICPICKRVYFADDMRKKYCSEKCRNIKNRSDWYAKPENKNTFLEKKKANYHANKSETEVEKRRKRERKKWNNFDFSIKEE